MAYRRNFRRYRRRRRYHKNFPSRRKVYGAAGRQLWRDVKKLKSMINVEYKRFGTSISGNFDYNGAMSAVNAVPQGDTDASRDGDSLKMCNLNLAATLLGTSGVYTICTLYVIWDPQNKLTAASDLLQTVGSADAPVSPKLYDKRFQSKILWERTFILEDSIGLLKKVKAVIPVHKHTQYNSGTTTVNSGALQFLAISNQVTTNLPVLTGNAYLTFVDN